MFQKNGPTLKVFAEATFNVKRIVWHFMANFYELISFSSSPLSILLEIPISTCTPQQLRLAFIRTPIFFPTIIPQVNYIQGRCQRKMSGGEQNEKIKNLWL